MKVLTENKDLFSWTSVDMLGIDPRVMCHRLSVCQDAKPISQKKRRLGEERILVVQTKVEKLQEVRFIRKIQYTTWLASVVLVNKSNDQWRMCMDYTNLNKACPKDAYPLPNIDKLVDGATGQGVMSFLDAYSGNNQIPIYESDQSKTTFMTDKSNFCYEVTLFGLKNVGANYQRLID